MKTYKYIQIEENKEEVNNSKLFQLLSLTILLFAFLTGLQLSSSNVKTNTETYVMDNNEELYRLALIQTFRRDYDEAIDTYKSILERDSSECLAYENLSELYLVKGLQEYDCDLSKSYPLFLESNKYADAALNIYENELGAIVLKSLALINLSKFYDDDPEKSTPLLVNSLKEIQRGIKINENYSDFWFALGEWWSNSINIPYAERDSILKLYFPNLEPIEDDYSCLILQALDAYSEAVNCRSSSVKGLFGKMNSFLLEHNLEEFYNAYHNIHFFTNYLPLNHYYLERSKELWEAVKRSEKQQQMDGIIG